MSQAYYDAIIAAVASADRPLRHREIAELLDATRYPAWHQVGAALTQLSRAGLLAREKCDGRYWHYYKADDAMTDRPTRPHVARIAELEAELARVRAERDALQTKRDASLEQEVTAILDAMSVVEVEQGQARVNDTLIPALAKMMALLLVKPDGELYNVMEWSIGSAPDIGELRLMMQRVEGKTISDLYHEVVAERDQLNNDIDRLHRAHQATVYGGIAAIAKHHARAAVLLAERDQARADAAQTREAAWWPQDDSWTLYCRFCEERAPNHYPTCVLALPHPGAPLLAELAELRSIADTRKRAIARYLELSGDCDHVDGEPDVCPGVERVGGPCHWCELRAAIRED